MRRVLLVAGALLLLAGLAWPVLQRVGLGRLPGDVHVEREGFRFTFPLVTCLLLSLVLTLLLWLFRR